MDTPTLTIEISNQQDLPVDESALLRAAKMILEDHDVACGELSIAIVDDPTIRRLNKQYLEHDYETDVISFLLDWDEEQQRLDGQLIVSTDTATREASEASVSGSMEWSMASELLLYVIHGALHLVGYDDKDLELVPEMRAAETQYLKRFDLVQPVAAAEEPDS